MKTSFILLFALDKYNKGKFKKKSTIFKEYQLFVLYFSPKLLFLNLTYINSFEEEKKKFSLGSKRL